MVILIYYNGLPVPPIDGLGHYPVPRTSRSGGAPCTLLPQCTVRPAVRVLPIPPLEADAFQKFTRRVHGGGLLARDEHLNGLIPHPRLRRKAAEERALACKQTLFRREPNVAVGVVERLAVDTVHDHRRFDVRVTMYGSPNSAVKVSTAKTSH